MCSQSTGPPISLAVQNIFHGMQIGRVAFESLAIIEVAFPLQAVNWVAVYEVLMKAGLNGFAIFVLLFVDKTWAKLENKSLKVYNVVVSYLEKLLIHFDQKTNIGF